MTKSHAYTRNPRVLVALIALGAIVLAIAMSGPSPATAASTGPVFNNPTLINNPYLPLSSLTTPAVMAGDEEEDGVEVHVRSVRMIVTSTRTFRVNGRTVTPLTVEDRVVHNDVLHEVALDYFAQADGGTVYYLGEDVANYDANGEYVSNEGTFLYGVDTKTLGVAMPANPQPGDRFAIEKIPGQGSETNRVITRTATVTVAAGTYTNVLRVDGLVKPGNENETKWYAPGVGVIKEADPSGFIALQ